MARFTPAASSRGRWNQESSAPDVVVQSRDADGNTGAGAAVVTVR